MRKSRWLPSEVKDLEEKGFSPKRTANAVRQKRTRMGLRTKRDPRPKWKKEDIERLVELSQKGFSARVIHSTGLLSFSKNAIQKQMCRVGLAKKNKIFKFPHSIRQKFTNFLSEKWQGKIPEDLVWMWNKENSSYPTNKKKVISYLTKLNLKIPYGEVQRIKNMRKKIQKIQLSKDTSTNILEKIRLERVAVMRKRAEKNRDIWTGLPVKPNELIEQIL
jgi:hypothetical protein